MRQALNTLATVVPEWMRTHSQAEWTDRYRNRIEDESLPKDETKRLALAEEIGADGLVLFIALFEGDAPSRLRELPAMRALQRVWIQNYTWQDERLRWRNTEELPPSALMISTPFDGEAHYSKKRSTAWVGYKVHLTETCTEDAPHVITHVETTPSTIPDSELTLGIQTALQAKDLLPHEHLVDLGYIDAGILVANQDEFGIDLIGPAKGDYHWQARANEGFAAENFQVDWQKQVAICPANKTSSSWTEALDRRQLEVIKIKFSRKDCAPCQFCP